MKSKITHDYERKVKEIEQEAINKIKIAENSYFAEVPVTQYY